MYRYRCGFFTPYSHWQALRNAWSSGRTFAPHPPENSRQAVVASASDRPGTHSRFLFADIPRRCSCTCSYSLLVCSPWCETILFSHIKKKPLLCNHCTVNTKSKHLYNTTTLQLLVCIGKRPGSIQGGSSPFALPNWKTSHTSCCPTSLGVFQDTSHTLFTTHTQKPWISSLFLFC